jgi:mRNA-degrading endonuclease RelE of RelBE toxin-antitoxin system
LGERETRTRFVITHISSTARSFLKRHREPATKKRLRDAFEIIARTPFHYQRCIRPLKGKPKGEYRYRLGQVRIHYAVDSVNQTIQILNIDDRGDITY